MHRQNIIFGTLLVIVLIAVITTGYATGQGPLGVLSRGISRLSGGRMSSSRTITEETKAPVAPELPSGLDQFRTAYVEEPARTRRIDRVLDVRVLQLPQHLANDQKVGRAVS